MDFTDSEVLDRADDDVGMESDSDSDIPLAHQAAANGEVTTLTRAIRVDPTVLEHQDIEGLTPLGHAVLAERLESVKLLVKMGAGINSRDHLGRTHLSMAAYQGWYDGVRFLLRNGAQLGIVDKAGRTALHSATYNTDSRVLELLLHHMTADDLRVQDNEEMNALHWASFHNRPAHLGLLLERGADITAKDVDGKTALQWAAQNGHAECCAVLLGAAGGEAGGALLVADADYSGKTALHYAAAAGHAPIIGLLHRVDPTRIYDVDPDERTPLHWAAATGQTESLRALLRLGADPGPVDVDGGTPLSYATQSGHESCVEILEERLGIRTTSGPRAPLPKTPVPQPEGKAKRSPLGFLANLFKYKRNGDRQTFANQPYADNDPGSESVRQHRSRSRSGSYPADQAVDDCNHNEGVSLNFSINGLSEGVALCEGCSSLRPPLEGDTLGALPTAHSPTTLRHKDAKGGIHSLERLHISRRDNPAIREAEYSLGELQASHSQNIPLQPTTLAPRTVSPPGESPKKLCPVAALPVTPSLSRVPPPGPAPLTPDHSRLIRSPPPMMRRDRSQSPAGSPLATRGETNWAQVEEDAAQILALHRDTRLHTSPASGVPWDSPAQGAPSELGSLGMSRPLASTPLVPSITTPGTTKQLAPIKGPVPRGCGTVIHKRLDVLRTERTGLNRSPTPPSWLNQRQHSTLSSSSSDSTSPVLSKKKKKKKRPSASPQDSMTTDLIETPEFAPDEPKTDNVTNHKSARSPMLSSNLKGQRSSPRFPANKSCDQEQRVLNRRIQNLLH